MKQQPHRSQKPLLALWPLSRRQSRRRRRQQTSPADNAAAADDPATTREWEHTPNRIRPLRALLCLRGTAVLFPLLLILSIAILLSPGTDWPFRDAPRQNSPPPPPCLVVYHIPKTGGTSVQAYLRRVAQTLRWEYRDLDLWAVAHPGQLPPPRASRPSRSGGGVVHEGHITPLYESLTDTRTCAKLTVLRDPIDRVISAFRSHPHTNHSVDVLRACVAPPYGPNGGTSSATAFVECPWDFEYSNDVTRRFANKGRWWNSFERNRYLLQRRQQHPFELEDGEELVLEQREDDLDRSMRRLRAMTAVCFLSDLAECVERFVRRTYGVQQPFGPDLVYNVGPTRIDGDGMGPITPALRQEIARANALDVRLYEWALETFPSNGTVRSRRLRS